MCHDFGLVDPHGQALPRLVVRDGDAAIAVEKKGFEDGEVGLFIKWKSVLRAWVPIHIPEHTDPAVGLAPFLSRTC